MSLQTDLNNDMKQAMKDREKEKLATIRMLKSAVQNEEIKKQADLTAEEEIQVLAREKKQRMESLNEFNEAGRQDLAEKIKKEIQIVDAYLPAQLTDEELADLIDQAISNTNAGSMKDMGSVMGYLMPQVSGRADGSKVSKLVQEKLS